MRSRENQRYVRGGEGFHDLQQKQQVRLDLARSHIHTGGLKVQHRMIPSPDFPWSGEDYFVTLADFRAWGEQLPHPLDFPKEFPSTPKPQIGEPTIATASEVAEKPLDVRERTSLLRIIRALDAMAKLPVRGWAGSVERQLEQLGFDGPRDATIRQVVEAARAMEPDRKPQ